MTGDTRSPRSTSRPRSQSPTLFEKQMRGGGPTITSNQLNSPQSSASPEDKDSVSVQPSRKTEYQVYSDLELENLASIPANATHDVWKRIPLAWAPIARLQTQVQKLTSCFCSIDLCDILFAHDQLHSLSLEEAALWRLELDSDGVIGARLTTLRFHRLNVGHLFGPSFRVLFPQVKQLTLNDIWFLLPKPVKDSEGPKKLEDYEVNNLSRNETNAVTRHLFGLEELLLAGVNMMNILNFEEYRFMNFQQDPSVRQVEDLAHQPATTETLRNLTLDATVGADRFLNLFDHNSDPQHFSNLRHLCLQYLTTRRWTIGKWARVRVMQWEVPRNLTSIVLFAVVPVLIKRLITHIVINDIPVSHWALTADGSDDHDLNFDLDLFFKTEHGLLIFYPTVRYLHLAGYSTVERQSALNAQQGPSQLEDAVHAPEEENQAEEWQTNIVHLSLGLTRVVAATAEYFAISLLAHSPHLIDLGVEVKTLCYSHEGGKESSSLKGTTQWFKLWVDRFRLELQIKRSHWNDSIGELELYLGHIDKLGATRNDFCQLLAAKESRKKSDKTLNESKSFKFFPRLRELTMWFPEDLIWLEDDRLYFQELLDEYKKAAKKAGRDLEIKVGGICDVLEHSDRIYGLRGVCLV
ncbi:hypothetical protein T439DRAFT_360349 [Meredithblackwellia eburnea MCA 4105]